MPPEADNRDERKAVVAATEPTLEGTFHASQMSALGYKRKSSRPKLKSAYPLTADIQAPMSGIWLILSDSPQTAGLMLTARLRRLMNYGNG